MTVYLLVFTLVIFGFLVMATDVGRLYLVQGELQTAADAAALASATKLVGTTNAQLHAGDQVTASLDSTTGGDNRFNLRINQIGGGSGLATSVTVDYFSTLQDALSNVNGGQSGGIDWTSSIYPKYVRVEISAEAPVLFVPLLSRTAAASPPTVTVAAVAGISTPVCTACGIDVLAVEDQSAGADMLNFGFVPGNFYTLYLTQSQQGLSQPVTQAPLTGTTLSARYAILNHVPAGSQGLDLDGTLFALAAGGISTSPDAAPPGLVSIGTAETGYPNLQGNTGPGTTVGQDLLCGLNTRFGVAVSETRCANLSDAFAALAPLFVADTDAGGNDADGTALQDYAAQYDGNLRRVLTLPVVDTSDALNVLNFRQFLIETSPTVNGGVDPTSRSGAFRAQYIGSPVPLHCGSASGICRVTSGVGRAVLH